MFGSIIHCGAAVREDWMMGIGWQYVRRAYHVFEKMVDAHCVRDKEANGNHWPIRSDRLTVTVSSIHPVRRVCQPSRIIVASYHTLLDAAYIKDNFNAFGIGIEGVDREGPAYAR